MTDPMADPMSEQSDQTTDPSREETKTDRVTVKRIGERGHYDRATIDAILDEAIMCHVGTVQDGMPMVIPTLHARLGDHLLVHGSAAAQMLRTAKTQQICVTVTLVDGFVLARSGMHHSMNYRSVVVLGQPELVEGDEKIEALDHIVETLVPGRLEQLAARPMTDKEIRATTVLRLPITEASAKVRTGPPSDDAEDYALPIWAGVLPITTTYGPAIPDPAMTHDLDVPANIAAYQRPTTS